MYEFVLHILIFFLIIEIIIKVGKYFELQNY